MVENPLIGIPEPCWSCGIPLTVSALLCTECGELQPATRVDYFQVFKLERKVEIDRGMLEQRFHRLSRQLHPDRFVSSTVDKQHKSLESTALLNDAYRTLRDSLRRVEYLLSLEGLASGEDQAGSGQPRLKKPPADLLEEVFELNLQLEEMRLTRKTGGTDPRLEDDLKAARTRFDKLLADVDADLLKRGEEYDNGNPESRASAVTGMAALLDRRRYIHNLVRDVNEALTG